jgi:hypothetical protein
VASFELAELKEKRKTIPREWCQCLRMASNLSYYSRTEPFHFPVKGNVKSIGTPESYGQIWERLGGSNHLLDSLLISTAVENSFMPHQSGAQTMTSINYAILQLSAKCAKDAQSVTKANLILKRAEPALQSVGWIDLGNHRPHVSKEGQLRCFLHGSLEVPQRMSC